MRIGTVLMACGTDLDGSSASVPATPMISVPPKAKSTRMNEDTSPPGPLGKKPPSLTRFWKPVVSACERPKTSTAAPPKIMAMTAPTLMTVKANSSSPNARAEAKFAAPTMSRVATIQTQDATSGNHIFMYTPMAVRSARQTITISKANIQPVM